MLGQIGGNDAAISSSEPLSQLSSGLDFWDDGRSGLHGSWVHPNGGILGVPTPTSTPMATAVPVRPTPEAEGAEVGSPPHDDGAQDGTPPRDGSIRGAVDVWITIFACVGDGYCGTMANGVRVHSGAAACGWAFDLGRHFSIVGDPAGTIYECEDRGLGGAYWVDIWFWSAEEGFAWLAQVGDYGTVILR